MADVLYFIWQDKGLMIPKVYFILFDTLLCHYWHSGPFDICHSPGVVINNDHLPTKSLYAVSYAWTLVTTIQRYAWRKTSNISRILVSNYMGDNSDVVGASPVGAAPTTSSYLT